MKRIDTNIFVKPTTYKNVLMRSKTESKAAQWLEGFGWSWIYEPESFMLGKHQYTPDFYVPEIDALVEVKPMDFMSEINRVLPIVENLNKTFFIIFPYESTFLIHDLYGRPDPCDGTQVGNKFAWASQCDGGSISIDTCRGKFPCHMIYMGSGCGNPTFKGDCCCTR